MSAMTSTVPAELKKLTEPATAARAVVTWFGVAPWPGSQFRLDAKGRGWSDGHTVRKPAPVGLTIVTFMTTPTAFAGTVQLPLVPRTDAVNVVPAPRGVFRGPTVTGAGRVSNRRQGVIVVSTGLGLGTLAAARFSPPAPRATATAAPTAAYRARRGEEMRTELIGSSSLVGAFLLPRPDDVTRRRSPTQIRLKGQPLVRRGRARVGCRGTGCPGPAARSGP